MRAGGHAGATACASIGIEENFRFGVLRFRIVAPCALKRAALEKHGCSDTGAIMKGEPFDIEHDSREQFGRAIPIHVILDIGHNGQTYPWEGQRSRRKLQVAWIPDKEILDLSGDSDADLMLVDPAGSVCEESAGARSSLPGHPMRQHTCGIRIQSLRRSQ